VGRNAPKPNAPPPGRAKLSPRARLGLVVAVAGCAALLYAAYAPAVRWYTRTRGEHMTAEQVRGLVAVDLPAGAADVRFYQHLRPDRVVVVDFAVDENGFLEWAARHGWRPEPIGGGVTVWPRLGFGDRKSEVVITDGYTYRNPRQRAAPNTVLVLYDRVRRRAYYSFWSAPQAGEG
jgi:hypothetical protein